MATERGLDRVVFFTDAVVAIAITLLILPLVDSVPEAADRGQNVEVFFQENYGQALGFVISFVVIARLWRGHHALFQHVRAYSRLLSSLSLYWTFTIAVLPLPTALIAEALIDRTAIAVYVGTMTASSILLSVMTIVVHRNAEVEDPGNPISISSRAGSYATTSLFAAALIACVLLSSIWPMFILMLGRPVTALFQRWLTRRSAASTPVSP